ncbi:spiralin repeat-containing protein [Spiroplasma endosymbiont of Glossina fuscipes fuscipes]|uniref:spiralin repeat-containing protein n=1 Tax=Spiroplasma endosymbiont of Glossina fuscipes fuscipes TaxID=2004463 RepID=UPI003C73D06E
MKKLLLILASLGITATPSFSLIACNPPQKQEKNILQTFQINSNQTGVEILANLHTFMQIRYRLTQDPTARKIATYQILYQNKDITNDQTVTVNRDEIVYITITLAPANPSIQFDQQNLVQEGFKLGNTYNVEIKVTDVNKQDIKTVIVPDLKTPAWEDETYQKLNTNSNIIEAVRDAINHRLSITASNSDFMITNNYDQNPSEKQAPGTVVTFTVSATINSSLIQGSFTFTNTLSARKDISEVEINNLPVNPNPKFTYGQLNNNKEILDAIIGTINNKLQITITTKDFIVTNDQMVNKQQEPSQTVTFTVTATENSSLIQGTFKFTVVLAKLSLNSVKIDETNIIIVADPDSFYENLNQNDEIIAAVMTAINKTLLITATNHDFIISNDQPVDKKQEPKTVITFTIAASETSKLIIDQFTFKITLQEKIM